MKKTIAILALAAVAITTANAGVHFGINLGIPLPVPTVAVPAPVVVAPPPVCDPPPMPTPFIETVPACPTPGYLWIGGNWDCPITIGFGHADTGVRQPTSSAPRIGTMDIEWTIVRAFTAGIIGVTVANR